MECVSLVKSYLRKNSSTNFQTSLHKRRHIKHAAGCVVWNVATDDLEGPALDVFKCFHLSICDARVPNWASIRYFDKGSDNCLVVVRKISLSTNYYLNSLSSDRNVG